MGFIYVTVVSKKNNNKRIEINVKNLKISSQDVSVYRSLTWTHLDFDDDPDFNSHEILYKYIVVQRNKRDLHSVNETKVDPNNASEDGDSDELIDKNETISDTSSSSHTRNKTYFYPKFVSLYFYNCLIYIYLKTGSFNF